MYVCTFEIFGTERPQLVARIWLKCFSSFTAPTSFRLLFVMPAVHQSISCSLAASTDLSERGIRSCSWVPRPDEDCFFCLFPPLGHQGVSRLQLSSHVHDSPQLVYPRHPPSSAQKKCERFDFDLAEDPQTHWSCGSPNAFSMDSTLVSGVFAPRYCKDIRVYKSRLTLDWTYVTQPSCWNWNCGLNRRPTTRQPSAPYSAWPPFEERRRLNFLLCGLGWIWGFANPESNLSSGPLATNQV